MAWVLRSTQTTLSSKASSRKDRSMVMVGASRHEARFTRAHSSTMLWRAKAFTSGPMVAYTTEHSTQARSTVQAPTCGLKVRPMRENSNLMSAVVMAFCTIPMEKNTKECGKMERSMVKVLIAGLMAPSTSSATMRASRWAMATWTRMMSALNSSNSTMLHLGRKRASDKKCLCIERRHFAFKMMERF